MRHLGFFLDRKQTLREHVRLYVTRAARTAQCLVMLGKSVRGMTPVLRRRLY